MFMSVALIHPSARLVPLLTDVARDVMADVELIHMVDEGLQRMLADAGTLTGPVTRRVCTYAANAQEAGAEAVMLTSPSLGGAIDAVRAAVRIPAVRIDAAMAERAVRFATSVGVVASAAITLEPTLCLLRERADALGRDVVVESCVCDEANRRLAAGDLEGYDRAVIDGVQRLAQNDVVVLADVMMHRVAETAGDRLRVPVLSSPRHGFEDLARKLNYFRR